MDPILYISLLIFSTYAVSKAIVRFRVVSATPWWVGDPVHFGTGLFVTRMPVEWAWLVSVLYVLYQVLDWKINNSDAAKDVAVYLAGALAGLGYDALF